jgi:hypothetical protein
MIWIVEVSKDQGETWAAVPALGFFLDEESAAPALLRVRRPISMAIVYDHLYRAAAYVRKGEA